MNNIFLLALNIWKTFVECYFVAAKIRKSRPKSSLCLGVWIAINIILCCETMYTQLTLI